MASGAAATVALRPAVPPGDAAPTVARRPAAPAVAEGVVASASEPEAPCTRRTGGRVTPSARSGHTSEGSSSAALADWPLPVGIESQVGTSTRTETGRSQPGHRRAGASSGERPVPWG